MNQPVPVSRRTFLAATGALFASRAVRAQTQTQTTMTVNLSCGRIGVNASQEEAIALAIQYGFQSVDPYPGYLADLDDDGLTALRNRMESQNIAWACGGVPVDFRNDDATFREGMNALPHVAKTLHRAGVERAGTWLMFGSDDMTYREYGRLMAGRLREIAKVLNDHNLRFGLEYVGTWSAWTSVLHPWVHTLAETLELIADIAQPNVGVILDSWHWYHANETGDDIRRLENEQVVAVDLNDAPAGLVREDMQDTVRELPAATGVIPVGEFLSALKDIHYDGPVRAEPFNAELNAMDTEEAVATTAAAMKKAFAQMA